MTEPPTVLAALVRRGIRLVRDGSEVVVKPASKLTDIDREYIRAHKHKLLRLLLLEQIGSTWRPGEWIAYRDVAGRLITVKFAGVATDGAINVWLLDGSICAVSVETIALDWLPDAAMVFEERLAIMISAGVPIDIARVRAEACTLEYRPPHSGDGRHNPIRPCSARSAMKAAHQESAR